MAFSLELSAARKWRASLLVMISMAPVGLAGLVGCKASDALVPTIFLLSPTDGEQLTRAADIDPSTPGTQVTVLAEVDDVRLTEAVTLLLDGDVVATSAPNARRELAFVGVTLPPGRHSLHARTIDGGVQSATIHYTLVSLVIEDPAGGTTLSASDDEDPNQPDVQRSIHVQTHGIALAETLTLRMDGVDVASMEATADGAVVFARQTFTLGEHTLQVVAGEFSSEPITVNVGRLCPRVDLVAPRLVDGASVTLGPRDDTRGLGCGDEFGVDVVAATDAGDGAILALLVNGTVRATQRVEGTVARFDGVVLGNRGSVPNRISFAQDYEGTTCRTEINSDLFVDCEGVSCEITSPTQQMYLNASLDRSLQQGFQGEFQVTTELSAIGQPVQLVVDGDNLNPPSSLPRARSTTAVADFSLSLSEGPHRMVAVCTDAFGNVTMSGEAMWTVDTIPCGLSVTAPRGGAYILESDDVDEVLDGVQIDLMASVSGGDCQRARAALCTGLASVPYLPISGTTPVARVSLSTNAAQSLCFEVTDAAGNLTRAETFIYFESDAPRLAIQSPSHGDRFNLLGNDNGSFVYHADLNPLTPACEVAFRVRCAEMGTDVVLHEYVSGVAIPGASAPCFPSSAPTDEYPGIATFNSVALPRLGTVAVVARQLAAGGRLAGASSPITLSEDCQAPTLSISSGDDLLCDSVLGPSLSGPGGGGSSITRDISVTSDDPVEVLQVRLRVAPTSGGAPIADLTSGPPFEFDDVNFSAFGEHDVVLTARDQAGNAAVAPMCRVMVVDAPALSLEIAEGPDEDNVVEAEDDCSAAAGLQIAITGTTDAPSGTMATVTVAGVTHVSTVTCAMAACGFSLCVDAPQGQVLVRAQVTDPGKPEAGVVERQVTIDSLPPTTPLTLLIDSSDDTRVRSGGVTFRWADVPDQGGITLSSYALRCSDAAIVDESTWDDAADSPLSSLPASAGSQRSETVYGFPLYTARYCLLRGADLGGALTPIAGSGLATVDFMELRTQEIEGENADGLGRALSAAGDLNGDGVADFLAGGTGFARIYFGQDGSAPLRIATITGPSDSFGEHVTGLGDINGDGAPDFAVSEPEAAIVYVFFGRQERGSSPDPMWPAQLDALIDTPLILRSVSGDRFGDSVAAIGDVNNDGIADFAIGAPLHDTDAGRVHVVLGRPLCTTTLTRHCLLLGGTNTLGATAGSIDGFAITGTTGAHFGSSFAALGDLNGDQRDELAIGSTGSIGADVDATLLVAVGTDYNDDDDGIVALDVSALGVLTLAGPEQAGHALTSLASLASSSAPGALSLAIPRDNTIVIGTLQIASGTLELVEELVVVNDQGSATDAFGGSLGRGGVPTLGGIRCDIDGDGLDELFVGSAGIGGAPGASELFLRSGLRETVDGNGEVSRSSAQVVTRAAAGTATVACVGDVTGDGHADLVSATAAAGTGAGLVTLFY